MRRLRLRCLALFLGLAFSWLTYALLTWRDLSSIMVPAAIAAALVALLSFVAAIMPGRWWKGLAERLESYRSGLTRRELPKSTLTGAGLLLLAATVFFLVQGRFHRLQTSPGINDPAAFLRLAGEVQNRGGPGNMLGELYRGEWEETNQNPLYIALLSISPNYEDGKLLSSVIGGCALAAFALALAIRYSLLVSGLFCCFTVTNFAFVSQVSMVTCECLLVLFMGLAWIALEGAVESAREGKKMRARVLTVIGGASLGACFLAKGTGPVYFGVALLWLLVARWRMGKPAADDNDQGRGGRSVSWGLVLLFIVSWGAAASPLLSRNIVRFGSPTYNVNSYLLFEDEFKDPKQLAAQKTIGEAAREYLRTHSLKDIAQRQVRGLAWESYIAVRSLGPTPLDDSRAVLGIGWLMLIGIGLITESKSGASLLLLWWMASIAIFAWYIPIAAGERFIVPLVLPTLAYGVVGLVRISIAIWGRRAVHLLSVVGLVWTIVWSLLTLATSLPATLHFG